MFSSFKAAWLPVWAVVGLHLAVAAATAQATHLAPSATSEANAVHPADAKAPVPAAQYRSPFTGYQAYADTPVAPWRDANELVRQRGGWRTYAREAAEPAAAAASADAAASAPPAVRRGQHEQHGK